MAEVLIDLILPLLSHLHTPPFCTWVQCFITRWLVANTVAYWVPILGIIPLLLPRHHKVTLVLNFNVSCLMVSGPIICAT